MVSAALLLTDAVLVVLFAIAGNYAHDSGLSAAAVSGTAWPFLAGLVLAWLLSSSWTRPSQVWPAGVLAVILTVVVGLSLRVLFTDGGAELSFILVATGTLGVLLLARRLVTARWLAAAQPEAADPR